MKGFKLIAAAGFFSLLTLDADPVVVAQIPVATAQIDSTELVSQSQRQQSASQNQPLIPGKAWKAINRAREDLMRGKDASAQKEIARALELAPHCAVALALQGTLDLKMGHPDTAADSFQKAVDNDPAFGAAYVGLATILISERRFKEALGPLDRAVGLLPSSWYTHFQTGLAQLGLGNIEAARKEAEFAERLTGTDPEEGSGVSYLHAMVSAKMRDLPGTRKYLADAIARSPHGYYAEKARVWLERLQVDLMNNR